MRAKLLRTFVLGMVLGMGSCKSPISSGGAGGARTPAAGGSTANVSTGGAQAQGTGGGGGGGTGDGPGTGGNGTGGIPGTGGDGTGGTPGTGGNGTGGTPGTGGNGTGGTPGTGGGYGGATSAGGSQGTDGGSTTSRNPLDLVPVDNDVPGWLVDRTSTKDPQRAMTATTVREAEALIDGAADGFFREPNVPTMFLWQNYINSTLPAAPDGATLMLFIFAMPSVEQAKGLYTAVLQGSDYRRRAGTPGDWREPATPPPGVTWRMLDSGTSWWINFTKDVFYVELLLSPSYGPPPDFEIGSPDTKQAALRFAQAIASRI